MIPNSGVLGWGPEVGDDVPPKQISDTVSTTLHHKQSLSDMSSEFSEWGLF